MTDTDTLAEAPEPVDSDEAPEAEAEDNADDAETQEAETSDKSDKEAEESTDDEEGGDDPSELITVEYEGQEYEVPPSLKDALLRQSDYSKKTMGLADQKKAFESQQAEMQQTAQLREQQYSEAVAIGAMDQQLAQYDQVNWHQLMDEDPVEFQRLDFERRQLTEQRQQANTQMLYSRDLAFANQQEQRAKVAEKTRSELSEEIPDWNVDLEEAMAQFAIREGVNERQLRTTTDKATLKILHKAYQFDQLQLKQRQTKPKPKPKEAKPVAKVKGRQQGAAKDPDKMSVDEWRRWRENQIAKRA